MRGRTISIYLPDGNARSVKICDIKDSIVKAIFIPRPKLKDVYQRSELKDPGIYFLIGDIDEVGKPEIYIGEVEIEDSVIENLISDKLKIKGIKDIVSIRRSKQVVLTSKEFMDSVKKDTNNKNLQLELLKKIIKDEIRVRFSKNIVKSKRFKERLEEALSKYDSRYITTAQVIETLIEIEEEITNTENIYDTLGLEPEEEAFYDLLKEHKEILLTANKMMIAEPNAKYEGKDEDVNFLVKISKELASFLKKNTKKIDWQTSEGFKKDVRAGIKDLLRKYGFKTKQVNDIIPMIMKQTEFTFGEAVVEV